MTSGSVLQSCDTDIAHPGLGSLKHRAHWPASFWASPFGCLKGSRPIEVVPAQMMPVFRDRIEPIGYQQKVIPDESCPPL